MKPSTGLASEVFTERTPSVINAAKLHRAAARKKARAFLVEGANSVEAAVSTGAARQIFATNTAAQCYEEILRTARYLNVETHLINERAAGHLADTTTPTGIFAVCTPVLWSCASVLAGHPTLVSIPVLTSDPGNAGTLIRVCDAMGADAVIFAGNTVDPQSPKAARASAGSLFHLPVAREVDINNVVRTARARGLRILATAADGDISLDEAQEQLSAPTAWLFGNEAHGLGEELLAEADLRVRIPIRGRAESLNLAAAASICLYESATAQARTTREAESGETGLV